MEIAHRYEINVNYTTVEKHKKILAIFPGLL